MEKRLRTLFNFQRIAGNAHLQRLIDEARESGARELDEDEADIWAAGAPLQGYPQQEEKPRHE